MAQTKKYKRRFHEDSPCFLKKELTFKDILNSIQELGSLELSHLDWAIRMEFKKRFNIDTIVLVRKK